MKGVEEIQRVPSQPLHVPEVKELAHLPVYGDDDQDLQSMVELFIKCHELPHLERFHLLDTVVVFSTMEESGRWVEEGRSELQKKNQNPEYITPFKAFYYFEKHLHCRLEVYAIKDYTHLDALHRQALVGQVTFNLHEIVSSPERSLTRELYNKAKPGQDLGRASIISEESARSSFLAHMQWQFPGDHGKSQFGLLFYRRGQHTVCVCQTDFTTSKLITWNEIVVPLGKLCLGDDRLPLEVHLCKQTGKYGYQVIGTANFTLADLHSGYELSVDDAGVLRLASFQLEEKYSFLEYLYGGCEISLVIGVDFTKSNGMPNTSTSLHCCDEESDANEYMQAINAVGSILQYYDSDKQIPTFGFGAKLPPKFNSVSHCFALNGNVFDPELRGIGEVLRAYKETVKTVAFHGPTHFQEIIDMTAAYAAASKVSQSHQQYFILLILTDGIINDVDNTIDAVVKASDLPLSIIIVGIGNEDFSMMKVLDADTNPLYSKTYKRNPSRDIVQFVPFSQFRGRAYELAQEVLYEIPEQLTGYMQTRGIKPQSKTHVQRHPAQDLLGDLKKNLVQRLCAMGYRRANVLELLEKGVPSLTVDDVAERLNDFNANNLNLKSALKRRTLSKRVNGNQVHFSQPEQSCFLCDHQVNTELNCGHRIACDSCVQSIGNVCPACHEQIQSWKVLVK